MRVRVTNHVFESAILKNELFQDKMEIVEHIIDFIQPQLFLPEDLIITMGHKDKIMYFIANGDCSVSINNHMK